MRPPDFIIIGAMKSATSSLHVQLGSQPGIFMSEPKEPNFFSDDDQYRRGVDFYFQLFANAGEGDLCGESSTHYTKLPDYPGTVSRMKALLPAPKLIYVMRHPIARLVSHYHHQWTENVIRCDINEALSVYPELINYSRYAYQLAPYFESFGKASVLPVFVEAVKRRPHQELQRVARFVGYRGPVAWRDDLASQNASAERIRKFPGYRYVVGFPPMTHLRRTLVPKEVRNRVKAHLRKKPAVELSAATVAELEAIFDEDLRTLSAWLDVDLRCRNFAEQTGSGNLQWAS